MLLTFLKRKMARVAPVSTLSSTVMGLISLFTDDTWLN